jgi:hypothetical protein
MNAQLTLFFVMFGLEKSDYLVLQIELSGFAQQNLSSFFSSLISVDLE